MPANLGYYNEQSLLQCTHNRYIEHYEIKFLTHWHLGAICYHSITSAFGSDFNCAYLSNSSTLLWSILIIIHTLWVGILLHFRRVFLGLFNFTFSFSFETMVCFWSIFTCLSKLFFFLILKTLPFPFRFAQLFKTSLPGCTFKCLCIWSEFTVMLSFGSCLPNFLCLPPLFLEPLNLSF